MASFDELFDELPRGASLRAIRGKAGEIFEEQVRRDPQTDYTQKQAFNDAIYFIAEAAKRHGFINLRGMSEEEIADEIGDSISRYLRNHGSQK